MEAPPDTVAPTVVEGTAASPATPAAPEAPTPALPAPPAEPAAPPAAPAPAAPQPPQARGVDAGSKRDQNSAALDGLAAQPPGRVLELRGYKPFQTSTWLCKFRTSRFWRIIRSTGPPTRTRA